MRKRRRLPGRCVLPTGLILWRGRNWVTHSRTYRMQLQLTTANGTLTDPNSVVMAIIEMTWEVLRGFCLMAREGIKNRI